MIPAVRVAFAYALVSTTSAVAAQRIDPVKELTDIADLIAAGKPVPPARAAAAKNAGIDINDLMHAMKPVARRGLGVEKAFIDASKRGVDPAKAADVTRAAHLAMATAEMLRAYAPAKPNRKGKGAAQWNAYNDEMTNAGRDFIAAVMAKDAAATKKAAARVNNACSGCHEDFR